MNDRIPTLRPKLEALCRRHHVQRLELFGTATGDQFNPSSSDLDFLVEFEPLPPGQYSAHYFGLLEDLAQLTNRPVNLVVARAIRNPYFLENVNQSRELVYAA